MNSKDIVKEIKNESKRREEAFISEMKNEAKRHEEALMNKMTNEVDALVRSLKANKEETELKTLRMEWMFVTLVGVGILVGAFLFVKR